MNYEITSNCPYWTKERICRLRNMDTFEQVADIAIEVLADMDQPISQLCGPITSGGLGCPKKNTRVFLRCIDELRVLGHNPFDQGPLQIAFWPIVMEWRKKHGEKTYCQPILDIVYHRIFSSGMVTRTFFLPNWKSSHGTRWERGTVERFGIKILPFPMDVFNQILLELGMEAPYGTS